ncbi:P-loop NTPase fold protein [Methanolobus sp. WCC1]|uniref:KAP family P-loop NTPase fold protein n=1 Tax=unclassified Methanolobus TaxID=2629569 RepID=UPI003253D7F7
MGLNYWISDEPINTEEDDLLQYQNVADILTSLLIDSKPPLTLRINGAWGTGKTSLMNLMKNNIDAMNKSHLRTSWFDTWQYNDEDEIWKLLMISVLEELCLTTTNSYDVELLINSALNIGKTAITAKCTGGASLITDAPGLLKSFINIGKSRQSTEQMILKDKSTSIKKFKDKFESLIEKRVGKDGICFIFVDDLDRIHPLKIIDIIESIKNFLVCKNCVFIVGCDYKYLIESTKLKYVNQNFDAEAYLNKIFQITYDLSTFNEYQVSIYLKDKLGPFFDNTQEFNKACDLLRICTGGNPRKMKKITNLYVTIENSNTRGLNNLILLKLICFIETWPEIHQQLLNSFLFGEYKYYDYETWARPKISFNDFANSHPPVEHDDYGGPVDDSERYEIYEKEKQRATDLVNSELFPETEIRNDYASLKHFLASSPRFPSKSDELKQYLSLIQLVDLNSTRQIGLDIISDLPSIEDILDVFSETIALFDRQKVSGAFFNCEHDVILPSKEEVSKLRSVPYSKIKMPRKYEGNLGVWFYQIVDSNENESFFESKISMLEKYHLEENGILWIIYIKNFPRSFMLTVNGKERLFLSTYRQLINLKNHLSSGSLINGNTNPN